MKTNEKFRILVAYEFTQHGCFRPWLRRMLRENKRLQLSFSELIDMEFAAFLTLAGKYEIGY